MYFVVPKVSWGLRQQAQVLRKFELLGEYYLNGCRFWKVLMRDQQSECEDRTDGIILEPVHLQVSSIACATKSYLSNASFTRLLGVIDAAYATLNHIGQGHCASLRGMQLQCMGTKQKLASLNVRRGQLHHFWRPRSSRVEESGPIQQR